ncbi:anaerobic carbon-monoxide dehydrogenase catalytic subunit [Desulfogranum japonicum]|uniref:hypothetical protein n=1 Tax=Desulfogranum japonicum TaxID=231447 RepID=UPI00041B5EE8|nr:hypothetical protein [Desulfogranum japonicum]
MAENVQCKDVSMCEHAPTMIVETKQDDGNAIDDDMAYETTHCTSCDTDVPCSQTAWETCTESSTLLFRALKAGRIRGMVCIMRSNTTTPEHDSMLFQLARELIQRDILVAVSGCVSPVLAKAELTGADAIISASYGLTELCNHLDISPILYMGSCTEHARIIDLCTELADHAETDISKLPIVTVTAQWHSQETTTTELNPSDLKKIYGTCFLQENNSIETANSIDGHIHSKRIHLAWCDQHHCSIHS